MKPLKSALACIVAFSSSLQAAILTVDNNPGSVAMFSSFQAAHNAASDGDTILIRGSQTDYGAHTVLKRLNIIGPGYNLGTDRNNIPGISRWPATITLSFRTSSSASAAGSSARGLDLTVAGGDGWQNFENPGATRPAGSIVLDGCFLRFVPTPLTARYTITRSFIYQQLTFARGTGFNVNDSAASGSL